MRWAYTTAKEICKCGKFFVAFYNKNVDEIVLIDVKT